MITKVTYRPYTSGVNNTQAQSQKVNFKANSTGEAARLAEELLPIDTLRDGGEFLQSLMLLWNSIPRPTKSEEAAIETIYTLLTKHDPKLMQAIAINAKIHRQPSSASPTIRIPYLLRAMFGLDEHGR